MNYIDELRDVIHKLHRATATQTKESAYHRGLSRSDNMGRHRGSIRTFNAILVHSVYAWPHETDDPDNPKCHVTVFAPSFRCVPTNSRKSAIVQEYRSNAEPTQAEASWSPKLPKRNAKAEMLRNGT